MMIPKMLKRRKARPLANKPDNQRDQSSKCVGIQSKPADANDKENAINSVILRPATKTNSLVDGTSMISYAMASSKVARSLDDHIAENNDYRSATSPREAKVIHPVVCKRDIFIGGKLPQSSQEREKPSRMSSVSASMLCRQMDNNGGCAQYRLRDGARQGIVNPQQLYGKSKTARSRPPRIVTAQLSSGPAGPCSTVSELSCASSAWASPAPIRQQTIQEEDQYQEEPENAIIPPAERDYGAHAEPTPSYSRCSM